MSSPQTHKRRWRLVLEVLVHPRAKSGPLRQWQQVTQTATLTHGHECGRGANAFISIYICIINLINYYLKAGAQKNSYFDDADQVFRSFGLLQCHLWGLWCLMSIPRFPNQCKSSMFHWEYHWLIMVNDG